MAQKKRPAAKSGARRPAPPVPVAASRSWGVIALYATAGVVSALIIGFAVYALTKDSDDTTPSTSDIAGLVDYRVTDPAMLTNNHVPGTVGYKVSPPVGGDHNAVWQNCMGDLYPQPIANENAVHSLEHGAVWITYRPDLPADQVAALAAKVRGTPYLMLSPYADLDRAISAQAWGYQLKLDSATDPRIDQFIQAFRNNAAPEPGAPCSGGTTATGTQPHNTPG